MNLYATRPGVTSTCAENAPLASGPTIVVPGFANAFQSPVTCTLLAVEPAGGV